MRLPVFLNLLLGPRPSLAPWRCRRRGMEEKGYVRSEWKDGTVGGDKKQV